MIQTGKVIEVFNDQRAKLQMQKHAACGDCGACQHGKENMNMNIVARNGVGANVGDFVEVNMETQNVLGAAFIMYVIPLMMLLIGVVGGNFILKKIGYSGNIEAYTAIIGFFLMVGTFAIIKMSEKKLKKDKRYVPVISKIMNEE